MACAGLGVSVHILNQVLIPSQRLTYLESVGVGVTGHWYARANPVGHISAANIPAWFQVTVS